MFPHQTPSRSLYLHLFPAVNGSPPVPPLPPKPSPLSPGEDCWANSRRCSQEPGQAHTTKPDLWRNIKHQEVCQHRQLIAANGGRGRRVVGGGWGCRQQTDTTDTDISANTARGKCGGCLCCCHVGGQEAGSLLWFILINCWLQNQHQQPILNNQ